MRQEWHKFRDPGFEIGRPTADAASDRFRIDAARNLVSLEPFLPGLAGIGHDEFLADDETLDVVVATLAGLAGWLGYRAGA